MLVHSKGDNDPHELIKVRVVLRVGDALGLNDQQALKGMDDFLNLFPLVWIFPQFGSISLDDLIDALVLLDEDEEEVMRGLSYLCLDYAQNTFSSDSMATTCGKS